MSYYVILGISPEADADAIRVAYRKLARCFHPDRGRGSSTERFLQITEAYETLSDPQRRQRYDRSLHRPLPMWAPAEQISAEPEPLAPRGFHRANVGRQDGPYDELISLIELWLFRY